MAAPKFIQARKTTIYTSVAAADTTIVLKRLVDLYGNEIDFTDFETTGYITVDPGLSTEEIISFTGLTRATDGTVTLTGVTRALVGVSPYGAGGTASAHNAGSIVVVSNNPQLYDSIIDYIDGIALAGTSDASLTGKGVMEVATQAEIDADTETGSTGALLAVNPLYLSTSIYRTRLPSANEKAALAGVNNAPSGSNLIVTKDDISDDDAIKAPIVRTYTSVSNQTEYGASDSQYDVTDQGGDTWRYTWNGVGTNPSISAANFPTGAAVAIYNTGLAAANEGIFIITASTTNYFEVTNANGTGETNKAQGSTGKLIVENTAQTWTKPTGLKYITIEMVGGGGGGGGMADINDQAQGASGAGGGYLKKLIKADDLSATIALLVGKKGAGGGSSSGDGGDGQASLFDINSLYAYGGTGGDGGTGTGGTGGSATGGDINISGQSGGNGDSSGDGAIRQAVAGSSMLGLGGITRTQGNGQAGSGYGAGGGAGLDGSSSNRSGGAGTDGIIIITEHYA